MKAPQIVAVLSVVFAALVLTGCVGGTFGDHSSIEEYPLRPASEKEGRRLKRCLLSAQTAQENFRKEKKRYTRRMSDLPLDDDCQDFQLAFHRTEQGYEITAQFHEGENTVRWSVNQDRVVEEHLDDYEEDDITL